MTLKYEQYCDQQYIHKGRNYSSKLYTIWIHSSSRHILPIFGFWHIFSVTSSLFSLPDDQNAEKGIQSKKRTRTHKRTFAMLLNYGCKVDQIFLLTIAGVLYHVTTRPTTQRMTKPNRLSVLIATMKWKPILDKMLAIIEVIFRILCGSTKIFRIFLVSNLVELILYILILRYLDR